MSPHNLRLLSGKRRIDSKFFFLFMCYWVLISRCIWCIIFLFKVQGNRLDFLMCHIGYGAKVRVGAVRYHKKNTPPLLTVQVSICQK